MALSRFDVFARSAIGYSAAGAQVYLTQQPVNLSGFPKTPPGPQVQLYSDPIGVNPISQPLVCDGFGHASAYVASGTFTEVVVYGGSLVQVYPDQFIASTIAVQVNGLEVNGAPLTGPNFNSTTPAAPTGSTAVAWQFDSLGNVTGSIPTSIYAPLASPTFTGTPAAPTLASSDDSTALATTAFVQAVVANSGLVVSVFGRSGAVAATIGDYTVAQITGAAPLASPALTGTPTAPTPATVDNSTAIATTAYVQTQGYGQGSVTNFSAASITGIATASVTSATTTPALTFNLNTQAKNTVWAGPTTGANAAPTFRALVAADIPGGSSVTPNEQAGSTYTIVNGDLGKILIFSDTAAMSVTLPQASVGGNFSSGWFCYVENRSIGFAVTITPTTSTINGQTTLILYPGLGGIIFCDGTNYFATVDMVGANVMPTSLNAAITLGVQSGAGAVGHTIVTQSIGTTATRLRRALDVYWEGDTHQLANFDYLATNSVASALIDAGSDTGASVHVIGGSFGAFASSPLGGAPANTPANLNGVRSRIYIDTPITAGNASSFLSYLPVIAGTLVTYTGFAQDAAAGSGTVGTFLGIDCALSTNGITVTNAFGGSFGGGNNGNRAALILDNTSPQSGAIAWGQQPTITNAIYSGTGSPNGAVTANVGSLFLRTDGGSSTTLYVKESGAATNTGWVAK